MDHTVDLALIQSEALYCLRKDQLVSLCKRYGVKPKGKVRAFCLHEPSHMADQLRQSLLGTQTQATPCPDTPLTLCTNQRPGSMHSLTWTGPTVSPISSARTPPLNPPTCSAVSLPPTQPSVGDSVDLQESFESTHGLGLGLRTSSHELDEVACEKPVRRTSTRPRHARALSVVQYFKERQAENTKPIGQEPAPSPSQDHEEDDNSTDVLGMLISALEEEQPNAQEAPKTDPVLTETRGAPGQSEQGFDSAIPSASHTEAARPAVCESARQEAVQQPLVTANPQQHRVWPELSHQTPPIEPEEAPLTHGDIRRIYAEILAEQEASRRAKKPISKVLRRMRTLLGTSSAPPQPPSRARAQAEPYPTNRKADIKTDYFNVADKEMLRMALYSSHSQSPVIPPVSGSNENTSPSTPSTPVVRSLRTARRLEPSTCQRTQAPVMFEQHTLSRAMPKARQSLR